MMNETQAAAFDSSLNVDQQPALLTEQRHEKFFLFVLAFTVVGFLVLFVSKPVHIDDTVFLHTARYLAEHPLKPFGAEINWGGVERSIFYEDNPFFVPYFFAGILKVFGDSEITLHLACLIFPLIALFSAYGVARRTASEPLTATALLVLSPAFLVTATTLMADVSLIALYLLSCYYYLRFCESESKTDGWLFALFIVLCSFTKYVGLSLIPLFLADSWQRGLVRKTALYLSLPILLFSLWCIQNILSFGAIHILEAGKSMNFRSSEILKKFVACLSFTGLSILGFTMFAMWKDRRDALMWGILFGILTLFIHLLHVTHSFSNTVLLSAGLSGAVLSIARIVNGQSDRFLLLWFFGMLVYSWLSEFIAARVVLLFAPPLVLLLSQRISSRAAIPCLVLNLLLSLLIGRADQRMADFYKSYGESFPVAHSHYIAHWGLQYYLERRGLPPFDYEKDRLEKGDVILVPHVAGTSFYPIPGQDGPYRNAAVALINSNSFSYDTGMFVMNTDLDAGWYCHGWGMLPFSFGYASLEQMRIYEVVESGRANPSSVVEIQTDQ
jgi:hypothetical protein